MCLAQPVVNESSRWVRKPRGPENGVQSRSGPVVYHANIRQAFCHSKKANQLLDMTFTHVSSILNNRELVQNLTMKLRIRGRLFLSPWFDWLSNPHAHSLDQILTKFFLPVPKERTRTSFPGPNGTQACLRNVKYAVGTNNSTVARLVVVMRERTATLESEQQHQMLLQITYQRVTMTSILEPLAQRLNSYALGCLPCVRRH